MIDFYVMFIEYSTCLTVDRTVLKDVIDVDLNQWIEIIVSHRHL